MGWNIAIYSTGLSMETFGIQKCYESMALSGCCDKLCCYVIHEGLGTQNYTVRSVEDGILYGVRSTPYCTSLSWTNTGKHIWMGALRGAKGAEPGWWGLAARNKTRDPCA